MTFSIGTPYTKNAGYLMNDDRNSGGKKSEADIQTCWHCQRTLNMQEHKKNGAICGGPKGCQRPICNRCAVLVLSEGCIPFTKRIDMYVEKLARRAQYRRLTGV